MARLLFWTNAFWPAVGGAEVWSLQLLKALAARGHDIRVVAVLEEAGAIAERTVEGLAVTDVPLLELLAPGAAPSLARMTHALAAELKALDPEIIVVSNFGIAALVLARLMRSELRAPWLLVAHNVWPASQAQPGSPLDGVVRSAASIVAFDGHVSDWIAERWPVASIRTIPHAIAGFDAAVSPAPEDAPLLFCGRLSPEKGPVQLLCAFEEVLRSKPQARLRFVGDGPERGAIEALLAARGLHERVTLLGALPRDGIAAQLDESLAVVMPSVIEGFGLVAAEAAWRGRATIASDVGGLRSNVIDGETGLLVPGGDRASLASAMLRLLTEEGLAQKLGRAARRRIERQPSWNEHVSAFEALLHQLARR